MKFLIDANIPRSTKKIIETLGYDVTDVRDVLPSASPDGEVASQFSVGALLAAPDCLSNGKQLAQHSSTGHN